VLSAQSFLLTVVEMRQLKIVGVLALAIILQSVFARWPPLAYIDLPLIVVVYFALQRDVLQALVVGAAAGLAMDALGGGLLGAGGFSKTLTAYLIYIAAARVMLDTVLLRIPVLAAATLVNESVFVGLHRLLGQSLALPFVQGLLYKLVATTIVGTLLLYIFEIFFSDRARQRRQFAGRRRVARRGPSLLRRR
jgi:rod shape-determining protein MreD